MRGSLTVRCRAGKQCTRLSQFPQKHRPLAEPLGIGDWLG